MLPLGFFRVPGFIGANTVAGLMNLVVLGTIFVLTLYLQVVQDHSALLSGVQTVPMFAPLDARRPRHVASEHPTRYSWHSAERSSPFFRARPR